MPMTRTRARQDINPMVTRTVHEVAFRLSYDMSTQISPRLGEIGAGFAPQQLRAMRLIWSGEETHQSVERVFVSPERIGQGATQ